MAGDVSPAGQVTPEIVAKVLEMMYDGVNPKAAAESLGVKFSTLYGHLRSPENAAMYAHAREGYAMATVYSMNEVALDESIDVQRARLLCDNIKWTASRTSKRFTEKAATDDEGNVVKVEQPTLTVKLQGMSKEAMRELAQRAGATRDPITIENGEE
jgi:hypothetical protein